MNTMKKTLILLMILSFAVTARAQQDDALCTWTTVAFDKTLGKWSFMREFPLQINILPDPELHIRRFRG